MVLGLLCAGIAALCYGVASVLQAMAVVSTAVVARATVEEEHGVRRLIRIVRHPRYLVGIGLDLLGFSAQVVATQSLPLFLVQATLAGSLAVTAIVACRLLRIQLKRPEWLAVLGVSVGLVLLGSTAAPSSGGQAPAGFGTALLISAGALTVVGAWLFTRRFRLAGPALGLLSGLHFGVVALGCRLLSDVSFGSLLSSQGTYAIVLCGAAGFVCYAAGLQRGAVTVTTGMLVVGQTVVPAVIGLRLLGDQTRPGLGFLMVIGFALAVSSAVALARFGDVEHPAIADLTDHIPIPPEPEPSLVKN